MTSSLRRTSPPGVWIARKLSIAMRRLNPMRFRARLLLGTPLLILLLGAVSATAADVGSDAEIARHRIVGEWHGTSNCVPAARHAACRDEEVFYTFAPADRGDVTLRADKIADGKRVPMYAARFHYDVRRNRWTSEIQTARAHALWSYTIAGDVMSGTLMDGHTHALMRRVSAKRQR